MNRVLLAAVCMFVCCTSAAAQGKRVLAIGFYNLENLFHPTDDTTKNDEDFTPDGGYHYTEKVYQERLANMANVLSQMATDVTPLGAAVIGIAEVENDLVLADLVKQESLKDRNYQFVWFPTPDVRGISTALLYNPKLFRVISAKPVRVPLELVKQNRPTRNVLYVEGVLAGNDTIIITVNHWPSRSGGVAETAPYRELAASVNRKLADSLMAINPNSKIVVMGDLNDNPNDISIKKIMQAKADFVKSGSYLRAAVVVNLGILTGLAVGIFMSFALMLDDAFITSVFFGSSFFTAGLATGFSTTFTTGFVTTGAFFTGAGATFLAGTGLAATAFFTGVTAFLTGTGLAAFLAGAGAFLAGAALATGFLATGFATFFATGFAGILPFLATGCFLVAILLSFF